VPRVGSRGTKVTAMFLNRMQQYLSLDEGDVWIRRMRLLYCPEIPLIEQDIEPFLDLFLPQRLTRIDVQLNALSGGGIIPAVIREIVGEIRQTEFSLLAQVERLTIPTEIIV